MRGRWGSHPQYGKQFQVEDYTTVLPATVQGILRYLGSGLIKGIGPKLAEKIVDHFGVASLDVIETTPQRLIEVPNLGPKRTALITAAWADQKAIKEVMVFLQGVGVSTSLAVRIYKQYADASIGVVRNEPYRLATDVWGIGFKTAEFGELDELTHAYAMTVHRAQGSEYPCVVIPITKSSWMMLQRNLLYTAVTRARKLVVLVGSTKAIGQAVRVTGAGRRHTALDYRLADRETHPATAARRAGAEPPQPAANGVCRQTEASPDRAVPQQGCPNGGAGVRELGIALCW